jgi:TetR/AcrR family transcriptional regulator, mexJK operon transcriptional repressor
MVRYGTVPYMRTRATDREADRSSDRTSRQEERRQALLAAAREVFDRAGYSAASLDQVIERVGGSRRAIYSLFGSKRDLFAAMATDLANRAVEALAPARIEGQSVDKVLLDFGQRVLRLLTEPTSVVLYRAIVAEGTRFPDLVATFFEHGPGRASAHLAEVLDQFERHGTLDMADSTLAAELFVGMLRSDLYLRVVLGLRPPPDDAEIERFVHAAVRTFLDGCRTPVRITRPSRRKRGKSDG